MSTVGLCILRHALMISWNINPQPLESVNGKSGDPRGGAAVMTAWLLASAENGYRTSAGGDFG
jgi:hypothetical protein